jgi:hypothetical protein
LWAIDAGRSVFDAEYRKRHFDALKMLEKGKKNSVLGGAGDGKNFNLTAALQTLEHPTATGGALIRYAQESAEDLKKAKQSDKGSIKEVANKKIKEQRELVDLIKYLSQNDSFLGGSNTNSERSITTAKAYFK